MSEELSMKDLQMKSLTEKIEMMLKGLEKSKRQELVRHRTQRRVNAIDTRVLRARARTSSWSAQLARLRDAS
jgi:hypothetical protein